MPTRTRALTAWFGISVLVAACASTSGSVQGPGDDGGSLGLGPSGSGNASSGNASTSGSSSSSSSGSGVAAPSTSGSTSGAPSSSGAVAAQDAGGSGAVSGTSEAGSTGDDAGAGIPGTCIASMTASATVTGTGAHKVTIETNSGPGINEGTIFRPTDLGGAEKYPILLWGESGCIQAGLSNEAAMGEFASHGYFVIADGTPNGAYMPRSNSMTGSTADQAKPLLTYLTWITTENNKPCSAYYHSIDTTKVATNGASCGGLMSEACAGDPRMTTIMLNSSGQFTANQALYMSVHTPVLFVLGGSSDVAYTNGENDYKAIAPLGHPIMLFSKALGHTGDLYSGTGDFAKIDVAWMNWWLKGDQGATGKGVLVGPTCSYCMDSAWEIKSMNIP